MEFMENPLELIAGAGGEDDPEVVLARDSNAVPSVYHSDWRKIGAMLLLSGPADGSGDDTPDRPSTLCVALQVICGVGAIFNLLRMPHIFAMFADMDKPDALLHVTGAFAALAWAALIPVISSTRTALRADGPLDELGAGTIMISEVAAEKLATTRMMLATLSAMFVLNGVSFFILGIVLPMLMPSIATVDLRVCFVLLGLFFCSSPVSISGSWASMYTASCLCRDAEIEVIKAIRLIDPREEKEWDVAVAQPALALRKKLELLSDGWSRGLAGLGTVNWVTALTLFTMAINAPFCDGTDAKFMAPLGMPEGTMQVTLIVFVAILIPLPLLMAKDVAYTSTYCDLVMDELNEARTKHGPESHLKIRWLESALEKLVRTN
jgi:hypothetical protein